MYIDSSHTRLLGQFDTSHRVPTIGIEAVSSSETDGSSLWTNGLVK